MAARADRTTLIQLRRDRSSPIHYPSPHVLVIDAHADTCELYELWLGQRAFTVTAAASGGEGLASARARTPDVLVVELMVPNGGVPLIRSLRAEAGCRDAVVLVLTTQASDALRARALEAGADVYLVKPLALVRLGEMMAVASRERSRLIAPEAPDGKLPSARLRQSVRRSRAIRERLV